ncbi:hypothetical protein SDC9_103040 [bioreactor metagenome]|uniref:Uncharacterized protein n=1 Tax=bioreactor metagenome TaxID=1076179 RepID=A0A645AU01_9ZZZZ
MFIDQLFNFLTNTCYIERVIFISVLGSIMYMSKGLHRSNIIGGCWIWKNDIHTLQKFLIMNIKTCP